MSQNILHNFNIYTCFTHSGCKSMSQGMIAKLRKNNCIVSVIFIKYLEIAVSYNSSKGFIKCALMLNITKTIYKYKISITINNCFTLNSTFFLIFLFHEESFFYDWKHRNCSLTCFCLSGIDCKNLSCLCSGAIIYQCMIHIDYFFL